MPELSNAAKVGLMIVVLLGALVFGYRYVSREAGTGSGYRVWAHMPDVGGVAPRSRVMISGVQVGVVERISLDQGRARVDVRMRPEFKLYEDAAIGKRTTTLIGEYFIVLTPGTEGKRQLGDGDQVTKLMEEASILTLQEQVKDILGDIKEVTNALRTTVGSDRGQQQIADILKNLADVTEQLTQAVKENRQGVRDTITNINKITAQSQPELAAILQNIRQVTEDVRELTAATKAPGAGPGELRSTVERINRASADLESVLKHADSVVQRVDRGEGTVGRLTKDETLINEVESVVEGVGDLVGGIGRVQTVVGLRTDYNFLANTIKSYVELRLQPAEDKYYMIEVVNDPRGSTGFEQIDVDTTNPNDPPHYREIRTITTNAFRFSFQFAKRLGPFTGRFGIRESTGGIGLDLHLLSDRFELRQDFFGFGEELSPRWRVALSYEFLRTLWLLGGVDDILNADRRDYFFGLQLRFNDEDLKAILPFAPTGL
ncbi:MAG: MCE family protein [Deltaproteobacteria bacterium]|nr:MCE family protein [Deltaproteobacteria bacterium]